MTTNYQKYFGTPERAALTLADCASLSMESFLGTEDGDYQSFGSIAETVMPGLEVDGLAHGWSFINWLNSGVQS